MFIIYAVPLFVFVLKIVSNMRADVRLRCSNLKNSR